MGSDLHVRHALAADLEEVLAIERNSYESPWSIDDFILHLRRLSNFVRVALKRDRVVGYYSTRQVGRTLRLMRLAVLPEIRFQRVGTEMMADLVRQTHDHDVETIFCDLSSYNDSGMIFLANFGFKFARTLRGDTAMRFQYVVPTGKAA